MQKSTGFSPMEILYGRKVNIHAPIIESQEINVNDEARKNLKRAAEKLTQFKEDRRVQRQFEVGQKVLVRKEPNKRRKDDYIYEGPYEILKFQTPHQVILDTPDGLKHRRIEWLKRIPS